MAYDKITFAFFITLCTIAFCLLLWILYLLPIEINQKYWKLNKILFIVLGILVSVLWFISIVLIVIDKFPENLVFFPYREK